MSRPIKSHIISMTVVNIHKSKFLITLLNHMLHAFDLLNKHDPALNQVAAKIKELISKPEIDGDYLTKLLTKAKMVVEGYDLKLLDRPKNDPIADLPLMLYSIFEELDNVITKKRVMDRISAKGKTASVKAQIEKYCSAIGIEENEK